MLTLETRIRVDGVSGSEIFDFLANPDDESYRAWWPGTHLEFHTITRGDGHVGDVYRTSTSGSSGCAGGVVTDAVRAEAHRA
jgi:hypothetical protein